ncbi:class I SAM-dependent methyltransferase [Chryseobacterium gossypii]|uniref:class I SAM-dependent methyltransferase n=1 Tax=Chryseobacterium gossypii TaxID=3231602 RepID=UPI0035234FAA
MKLSESKKLIEAAFTGRKNMEKWADLGCGDGAFTNSLAAFLGDGSMIYAIDQYQQDIQTINDKVHIEFILNDFEKEIPDLEDLDGILMANSLHYIADKKKLITGLEKSLKTDGKLIIVEYDTQNANQWVPFPINFKKLKQLFTELGFEKVEKIGERDSVYSHDKMYSALIKNG